jgi:acyl-CoA synthetase (AMP-forming)/AMP-acid ligase II
VISVEHPARRALLGDQLRRNAARLDAQEAIVAIEDGARRAVSYAELNAAANRFANALLERGIGRGDVVALLGRSSPELLIAFWGAVKAGAAVTGVNPTFTSGELHHQLAHSAAAAIVADLQPAGKVDALEQPLPALRLRLVADACASPGWEAFGAWLAAASDAEPELILHEDDPALIPYTSGTTARAKAVVLTHRNYLASTIPAYAAALGFREGDRFYYVMPLHTIAGLGTQVSLLSVGATVVLPGAQGAAAALATLARERITIIGQTPTFYLQLSRAEGFGDADLGALERCVTYGGTMPQAMFDAFSAAAPGLTWFTLWSQSELAQTPTVGRFRSLEDIPGQDPAWIGRPVAQLEIRIADEDGRDAQQGELLCRSPGLMLGYLRDRDRTAEVLRGGWLRTGDLVRRDAAGNLFFVDRRHDVIKSGGMNVSSVEVERALYANPGVLEAAVVGVSDEYWGQTVTAFVVARDGATLEVEELLAGVRERLAPFKVPKAVHVVPALPKDAQGKILKRELRG